MQSSARCARTTAGESQLSSRSGVDGMPPGSFCWPRPRLGEVRRERFSLCSLAPLTPSRARQPCACLLSGHLATCARADTPRHALQHPPLPPPPTRLSRPHVASSPARLPGWHLDQALEDRRRELGRQAHLEPCVPLAEPLLEAAADPLLLLAAIREILAGIDLSAPVVQGPKQLVNLGLGDPSVFGNHAPAPEAIAAIEESLKSGRALGYPESVGYADAREAVAKYFDEGPNGNWRVTKVRSSRRARRRPSLSLSLTPDLSRRTTSSCATALRARSRWQSRSSPTRPRTSCSLGPSSPPTRPCRPFRAARSATTTCSPSKTGRSTWRTSSRSSTRTRRSSCSTSASASLSRSACSVVH